MKRHRCIIVEAPFSMLEKAIVAVCLDTGERPGTPCFEYTFDPRSPDLLRRAVGRLNLQCPARHVVEGAVR